MPLLLCSLVRIALPVCLLTPHLQRRVERHRLFEQNDGCVRVAAQQMAACAAHTRTCVAGIQLRRVRAGTPQEAPSSILP